jgi:GT2 family glycosyltransferase
VTSSEPKVSIIIATVNREMGEKARSNIEQVLANTIYGNFEVIAVEYEQTEELKKIASRNFKILSQAKKLSFARNCNAGLKYSSGDYSLLLNNDVTVLSLDWLKKMVECGENDKSIGIIGAKLLYPSGKVQHCGGFVLKSGESFFVGHYGKDLKVYPTVPTEVDYVTGACLLVKKAVVEKIGFLDEGFMTCFEDTDYCLRANRAGYKTLVCPSAVLIHEEMATRRSDPSQKIGMKDDYMRFKAKWISPNIGSGSFKYATYHVLQRIRSLLTS